MPRFLKVEGESLWLNLDHLAGLLETRYEATGAYDVAIIFHDPGHLRTAGPSPHLVSVKVVPIREDGEASIRALLEQCPGERLPVQTETAH